MSWRNLRSTDPAKQPAKDALRRRVGVKTNRVTLMKYDSESPQTVTGHVLGAGGSGPSVMTTAYVDFATRMYTVSGHRKHLGVGTYPDRIRPFKVVVYAKDSKAAVKLVKARYPDGCAVILVERTVPSCEYCDAKISRDSEDITGLCPSCEKL